MTQLSFIEISKETERLKRLPQSILVDFIRSLVAKSQKDYHELKMKTSMRVKASYNPEEDEDSFTISTYKKNELLKGENDRLHIEISTLQADYDK